MTDYWKEYGVTHLRDKAQRAALYAGGRVPNGPAAADLKRAGRGENDDLALAIALILKNDGTFAP